MNILIGILDSLLILASFFLICLVLIQRGKGGGLAGAFGGMGGSSAFGTKAGDVFTKVTMSVAAFWIVLCMLMVIISNRGGDSAWGNDSGTSKVTKGAASTTGTKSKKSSGADLSSTPAPAIPSGTSTSPQPIEVPAVPAPIPPTKK
ncbi:preprotein translocase subunit SecG [Singulisphaera sp. GP187]|uniref:preprotein translocase subunit SecG n=1 Tax=Singulisphaera sp. GP187 TaxID=1882752 RepID=UPI00092941E0|nr:preprotein translocase subunit SecG [Singulisphaera sp. GP187]SIO64963.1 preprotein translocase subunit SecG [Singulisphaera sp. GP187]